jgi:NAD(P)-dependent dehydrogenase (short-subunit alcohol dehydrogenase family)
VGVGRKDLVSEGVAGVFRDSNHVAVAFGGGGGEIGVVRAPVDAFVERKPKEDTDVGGVTKEEFEGCPIVEGWGGNAVADKTDVLKGKEPTFVGSTGAVEESVDVMFEGLVSTFGWILVLVVGFGLPCADEVSTENVLNGFAELDLCTVSDEA